MSEVHDAVEKLQDRLEAKIDKVSEKLFDEIKDLGQQMVKVTTELNAHIKEHCQVKKEAIEVRKESDHKMARYDGELAELQSFKAKTTLLGKYLLAPMVLALIGGAVKTFFF